MRSLTSPLLLLLLSLPAQAHQTMSVVQAFAIETVAGMANGAAYVSVKNTGPSDAELVGVSGDMAEFVQIHTHVTDGALRRMVALELPIILRPGEQLLMEPGGVHIMLLGLEGPLGENAQLDLTLHFKGRHVRDLDITVPIFSFEDAQVFLTEPQGDSENLDADHSGHNH